MQLELFKQTVVAQVINLQTLPNVSTDTARLKIIFNLVFTLTGAIALLVITIAGFRYAISHGDASLIAQSKNAIIYALVGLTVSIAALAIVNFVVGKLG